MSDPVDCVAIVTARGGSKRLPGKNVRLLGGKPLIAWTIEAARTAATIRRTIVSTDDDAIAAAAAAAGAEVPFRRPAELSGDQAAHYGVLKHAIDWLEADEGRVPEFICLLQPTSPLRTAQDIDSTVRRVIDHQADCGISVAPVVQHPAIMFRVGADLVAHSYLPAADRYVRSQDYEKLYYVNGAVYVLRPATFRLRDGTLSKDPVAFIMPRRRSVDIDDENDFLMAETLLGPAALPSERD